MTHALMTLPFAEDAFEPIVSKETIEFHYGKHHAGYVNKLNNLIKGTEYEDMDLVDIIKNSDDGIFNNAAQVYNHNFYWMSMTDQPSEVSGELMELIIRDFGSIETLKEKFLEKAASLFGSGWTWLSMDINGKLLIEQTSNAENPLIRDHTPLMTCDVWEHAYYIDYRNARASYLEKWWELIDWDFVSHNVHKHDMAKETSYISPCNDENDEMCAYIEALQDGEHVST